jgi:hypothetical protein
MNCTDWLSHSVKIGLLVPLILPLAELATAPASAQGLETWNKPCLKLYKKWKTTAKHTAFAVSNSSAGGRLGQSCGYLYDYPTKAGAEVAAIKFCETDKRYRSGRCYVTKSE